VVARVPGRGQRAALTTPYFSPFQLEVERVANAKVEMVPLTAEHLARFQREAPAELARRNPAWFAEQAWSAFDPAITGSVSLVGLWLLGWPAPAVLAFSLACIWNGVLCDAAKLVFARAAVERAAREWNVERGFWTIAEAIHEGRNAMRADALRPYRPATGLGVDVMLGSIATVVLVFAQRGDPREMLAAFSTAGGMGIALGGALAVQWLATLATIVLHRRAGDGHRMRFGAGMRGVGLFVLMVVSLVMMDHANATTIVVAMNVGLLLLAALLAWSLVLLRRETDWLRGEVRRAAGR
jgi:hypothetical protein